MGKDILGQHSLFMLYSIHKFSGTFSQFYLQSIVQQFSQLGQQHKYRGKVVEMRTWKNALAAAKEHVRKLGRENQANVLDPRKNSHPGVWHNNVNEPHPFRARFRDDWKTHLSRSVSTLTSIQEMVDHTIDEGNRLFAGTAFANRWLMYHNALPQ